MRNDETWEKYYKTKSLNIFPPRILKDLETILMPDDLLTGESKSTFIYGEIASGKTIRAAQMILQEVKFIYLNPNIFENQIIIFVSFPELFAEIKSTFNNKEKSEYDIMQKYLTCHLLVIDDFISTRPTEWILDVLYYLINYRYEYLLKTIITSNLSLTEIEDKIKDQRITSRIDRMCIIEKKKHWNK